MRRPKLTTVAALLTGTAASAIIPGLAKSERLYTTQDFTIVVEAAADVTPDIFDVVDVSDTNFNTGPRQKEWYTLPPLTVSGINTPVQASIVSGPGGRPHFEPPQISLDGGLTWGGSTEVQNGNDLLIRVKASCNFPVVSTLTVGDVSDSFSVNGYTTSCCFLTTAVVERRGEADDGPTLTLLRGYRDGYMTAREDLRPFIAEYYRVAPYLVAAIPQDHADWDWIETQVDICADLIRSGEQDQVFAVYRNMVDTLVARWLSVGVPA